MFEEENENMDFKSFEKSRIYKKAMLIWDLAYHIAELASKTNNNSNSEFEKDLLKEYAGYIVEDASKIAPKIAGAWGSQLYDLKMENAAIIRKAARELSVHMTALKMHGFKEIDYCDLLRNEIEEFRILFAEWVKTFDPWDYLIDRWGLFNPPGVNYDDHDPDDDIPFDASDFFRDFDEFGDLTDEEDDNPED
ncbi:hypothetical protein [Aequorivita viscosa]|uniref:Uncharacterized protein n=1 Tax=Aequorivita viscosa TaxID=797419 RepID=A0A1M6G8H1_9FLAO|nr:hypothetical protein [Aequorivita viscosa]SDW87215.1 hypothetical protein SAMN05216556_111107 [Aequorivita viscosa]SHJ06270.1 hypothetical protein SAMN04487908_1099 [Aequorivita viscosa]